MAITKILARSARLDRIIQYVLNGDKTDGHILTAHQNCDPGRECRQMLDTKREVGKMGGRQCYHIIQSFKPGEVSPELALEIAKAFAAEHLADYEVVIATHIDKGHIHSHLVFNSVNAQTGEKYHVTTQEYYQQIRAVSDRLCREHGLSVIMAGQPSHAVSYTEWLRQSKGQPTFRSMLEADMRDAIDSANDLGHFYLLMEHMGYEIYHGSRLGFRLRGQDRFMYPGRRNGLFTEEGIRAAIEGNLTAIEAGQRQYPPRASPRLRQEVTRAERYRAQFAFLRENEINTPEEMSAFESRTEETLADLTKQRTIFNVRKKRRKKLYDALADAEALAPAARLYGAGLSGMEEEFARYMDALDTLERCPIPRDRLTAEKADVYRQLAEVNRQIRAERKKLALCRKIRENLPRMEQEIQKIETKDEVIRDDHRRR